jgi:hypothetical protein
VIADYNEKVAEDGRDAMKPRAPLAMWRSSM